MPNHPHNGGRNIAHPDENQPTWRPQDEPPIEESRRRLGDERLRELRGRPRRDDASPGSFEDRHREDRHREYWLDRSDAGYRGRDFEPERRSLASYDDRTGYASGVARGDERLGYAAGWYGRHVHRGIGPHRGKGPVGYHRSDERLRDLVCEALTDDDQIDASRVEVSVKAGEVTLSGNVEDRRAKRDAEDCAWSVPGVRDVQNVLRVVPA